MTSVADAGDGAGGGDGDGRGTGRADKRADKRVGTSSAGWWDWRRRGSNEAAKWPAPRRTQQAQNETQDGTAQPPLRTMIRTARTGYRRVMGMDNRHTQPALEHGPKTREQSRKHLVRRKPRQAVRSRGRRPAQCNSATPCRTSVMCRQPLVGVQEPRGVKRCAAGSRAQKEKDLHEAVAAGGVARRGEGDVGSYRWWPVHWASRLPRRR